MVIRGKRINRKNKNLRETCKMCIRDLYTFNPKTSQLK